MLAWTRKNKEWLFSGAAVGVPIAIIGWLWFSGGDVPPVNPEQSTRQTHSSSGDNVAGDKIIHQHWVVSVDYKQLVAAIKDVTELHRNQAEEVKTLKKWREQRLEEVRETAFRLYEILNQTSTDIERERLRKVKSYFDQGKFQAANAVLLAWQEPRTGRLMTWIEARKYVNAMNRKSFMGHSDWRLPTVGELQDFAQLIQNSPDSYSGLDQLYWSSEDFGPYSVEAKAVNLGNAPMGRNDLDKQIRLRSKENRLAVRLVHSLESKTTARP